MSHEFCKGCECPLCKVEAHRVEPVEALARELYDIGAVAIEAQRGSEMWHFDDANPDQKEGARAIARHVLKNFDRRAAK